MAGDVDDVVVVSDIMLGVTAEDGRVEAVGADEVRVAGQYEHQINIALINSRTLTHTCCCGSGALSFPRLWG